MVDQGLRMAIQLEGFTEVSEILRSGVYALVKNGVVIYVGKSKSLYARLYAHRTQASRASRGKPIPTWLPVKGFVFDQVFVRYVHVDALDTTEREMIERYKPRYNESLKSNLAVRVPITISIGSIALKFNAPSPQIGRRF